LAIQCISDFIKFEKIPIFIRLKDYAESKNFELFQYILKYFSENGIKDLTIIEEVLNQGKAFILLDGLDEVREEDSYLILNKIQNFQERFYKNTFIMTCRTAANTYIFEEFTEVEILDFSLQQIQAFVSKWFWYKSQQGDLQLLAKIKASSSLQELASNPLLLTLLCLDFENTVVPSTNHFDFYRECTDVLLKSWDAKRNIDRGNYYGYLSISQKKQILGTIALDTLKQDQYLFSARELERQVTTHLELLLKFHSGPNVRLDSESVLKLIEAQHGLLVEQAKGLFSFSHQIFHEYFAAQKLTDELIFQGSSSTLSWLVTDTLAPKSHQVLRLVVKMLPRADVVLQEICQHIEQLTIQNTALQSLLTWVNQKALTVEGLHQPFIIRAFYLDLALTPVMDQISATLALPRTANPVLLCQLDDELKLDLTLNRLLTIDRILALDRTLANRQKIILGELSLLCGEEITETRSSPQGFGTKASWL
jgi:predicted NACHT family NTPase